MSVLDRIVEKKRDDIERLYQAVGLSTMKARSDAQTLSGFPFEVALAKPGLSLIAEVKKASPSKGIIREDFDPVEIAQSFESRGARCLSVLTETHFFLGDPAYLTAISQAVSLPILRKDFIIDPIQVYESVCLGASAILLIAAILTPAQLAELHTLARSLGLSVLVEVHNDEELSHLSSIQDLHLVGVNNRDLTTFDTSLETVFSVSKLLRQQDYAGLVVAESGYQQPEELSRLDAQSIDAVLIGEGLAKYPNLLNYFGGCHEN